MNVKLKPLHEQVIVITGASSGIGLATARMAAEAGARLVLVARNEEALKDIERELDAGDTVKHLVGDVGKREDMERVASQTITQFGGFDTWINNAGSAVWGRLDEVSDEDHEKVMQTNFFGTLYGSNIAARHLRDKGGAIINLGSVESVVPMPFHSSYSASKHAVKAMTDVLRVELEQSGAPVSVTLVRPPAINTMFNDHSKSYLPSAPSFPPPVYSPDVVAQAILHAAVHPQRDVYIRNSKMFTRMAQLTPRLVDVMSRTFIYDIVQSGRPDKHRGGTLHNSDVGTVQDGQASGQYPGRVKQSSLYNKATQHPVATALIAVGAIALIASIVGGKRAKSHKGMPALGAIASMKGAKELKHVHAPRLRTRSRRSGLFGTGLKLAALGQGAKLSRQAGKVSGAVRSHLP